MVPAVVVDILLNARGPGMKGVVCRGGRAGSAMAAATGPSFGIAGSRSIAAPALVAWRGPPPVDARLVEVVFDNAFCGGTAMRVGAWVTITLAP